MTWRTTPDADGWYWEYQVNGHVRVVEVRDGRIPAGPFTTDAVNPRSLWAGPLQHPPLPYYGVACQEAAELLRRHGYQVTDPHE